jgi:hypothetical protein
MSTPGGTGQIVDNFIRNYYEGESQDCSVEV